MVQSKDTDWMNGYKDKICIYDIYKRLTSDLKSTLPDVSIAILAFF